VVRNVTRTVIAVRVGIKWSNVRVLLCEGATSCLVFLVVSMSNKMGVLLLFVNHG
jgi:hypothetical protein